MRARLLAGTVLALWPGLAGAQETITYGYDAKGRLTQVAHSGGPVNGETSTYAFDAADNRTNVTVSGATDPGSGTSAATVADAGFESPDTGGGFVYNPTASGATFASKAGVAGNGSAWGFAPAPDGHQVAFVQSDTGDVGQITLAVSNLQPGQTYAVTFKAAQRPGFPVNPITVQFGSTALGTFTPGSTGFESIVTRSFQATSSTGTITLTGAASSTDIASGVDSVSVIPAQAQAITSFETPNEAGGFAYAPSAPGMTFSGYSGIAANGSAWAFAPAPDGQQVAFIQGRDGGNGQIALAVSNLQPGQTYAVVFKAAQRPSFPVNPITVQFGSTALGTFAPSSTSFETIATETFQPTGSSGTITLTGAASSTDIATGLDSVSVVAVPAQPNASFETPDQSGGFAYTPTAPGMTFSGYAGIAANGSAWAFAPAPDGRQVAFLQGRDGGNGQLVMALSNLVVGARYKLVFYAAQRLTFPSNPISVSVGGQPLGTFTPGSTQFQAMQTGIFTASATTMQATFTGAASSGDIATGIDAIAAVPVNSS